MASVTQIMASMAGIDVEALLARKQTERQQLLQAPRWEPQLWTEYSKDLDTCPIPLPFRSRSSLQGSTSNSSLEGPPRFSAIGMCMILMPLSRKE